MRVMEMRGGRPIVVDRGLDKKDKGSEEKVDDSEEGGFEK